MDWLRQRFLRIDPRSLGLFRFVMGLTLIADLLHRWDWIKAFYSNEGLLPNHNHLFLIKGETHSWSFFHSFSSVEEAHTAFFISLLIYGGLTLGWYTRVFQGLSLVVLVALAGRNVLLASVGHTVAISLLAITFFLPLGHAFSVDSLRRSFAEVDEKRPEALNDRSRPTLPRMTPSLVPVLVIVWLGLVHYGAALAQTGATWQDGTALYYALHVDRWTSASGVAVREALGSGILAGWTKALRISAFAAAPLALVPVARKVVRPLAIALVLFYGLTFGVFFTFGLYGWTLVAAAALLLPEELWESLSARRPIEMVYDEDCGVCLWCARLVKRLDLRRNVTFVGNGGDLPKGVDRAMVERSMVVVTPDGEAHTDSAAISNLLRSLPLLAPLGWLVLVPGLESAVRVVYRRIADRRLDISVSLGMGACGVPVRGEGADSDAPDDEPVPARRFAAVVGSMLASLASLGVIVLLLASQGAAGKPPVTGLGESPRLVALTEWTQLREPLSVWSPDPPQRNEALVVDATTRGDWNLDPLTGYEPDLDLDDPRRARKGVLWEAYSRHIADDDNDAFRREFRSYLSRGGFAIDDRNRDHQVLKLDAFWVGRDIPPPGQPATEEVTSRSVLSGANLMRRLRGR